jgi:hypothetical protein
VCQEESLIVYSALQIFYNLCYRYIALKYAPFYNTIAGARVNGDGVGVRIDRCFLDLMHYCTTVLYYVMPYSTATVLRTVVLVQYCSSA